MYVMLWIILLTFKPLKVLITAMCKHYSDVIIKSDQHLISPYNVTLNHTLRSWKEGDDHQLKDLLTKLIPLVSTFEYRKQYGKYACTDVWV